MLVTFCDWFIFEDFPQEQDYTMSKIDSWWEAAVQHRSSVVLGDDLEVGWERRRDVQEGGDMYMSHNRVCCTTETNATWESNYTSI